MQIMTIDAKLEGFDNLRRLFRRVLKGDLPNTAEAVETATDLVQTTWIQLASGVKVSYRGGTFVIQRVSGNYVRSIEDGREYPLAGDPYMGRIVSMAPYAAIIESGIEPYDMKPGLLKGRPYATIAFRHGTPGTVGLKAMPQDIYNYAQNLRLTAMAGGRMRRVPAPEPARRQFMSEGQFSYRQEDPSITSGPRRYLVQGRYSELTYRTRGNLFQNYGIRSKMAPLVRGAFGAREKMFSGGYSWKSGPYQSMYRMQNAVGGSQYVTFRRISRNSDPRSWIHPGVRPKPIRQVVVEKTQREIVELIRTGFELDMQQLGVEHF